MRLDPPARAEQSDLGRHHLRDERRHLDTHSSGDHCHLGSTGRPLIREELLGEVLAPDLPAEPAEGELSVAGGTWRTERTERDEQPCMLYTTVHPTEFYQ